MSYASSRRLPTKADRAALLTLALASLLVRGGEHVAPLGRHMMPTMGRTALYLLSAAIGETESRTGGSSLPPFEPLPRYGRVVLMSDFMEPLDDVRRAIGLIADRGVDGYVLQVLDPSELALPFTGRKNSALLTLSTFDALRVFSMRCLVAAKASRPNAELINGILQIRSSKFMQLAHIFPPRRSV